MNYPSYSDIEFSKDLRTFKFLSKGVNGPIWKVVQYSPTGRKGVYNLAFGDLLGHGYLDDATVSANGDRDMVLATVAMTVYAFLERYPRRAVIFQGSSPARTRLYRMAISKAFEDLESVFEIKGLLKTEDGNTLLEDFEKGKNYMAFLVRMRLPEFPNPPP